jgi:hypothetical protein
MNDKGVSRTSERLSYPALQRVLLATDDNEDLATYRDKGQEFLDRYEMSWIYHDNVGE